MIIAPRYNGPPDTGNGGYTSGLVAEALLTADGREPAAVSEDGVEVTLRLPPPLDRPLTVTGTGEALTVYDDEQVVAEAVRVGPPTEPPVPAVGYPEASAAAANYPGFTDHPFPTCFVCGPHRPADDGLRIYPGPLPDGRVAAPWQVPAEVSTTLVWAALDCPGGWAVLAPGRPYVLGRMTAWVRAVPAAGSECVVVGARTATQGRKAQVRTALYGPAEAGAPPLAQARATWLAV